MIKFLRRLCVLVAMMFWQGGFMFYGAIVVPVGTQVLGSQEIQGFITRAVTNYLNLAGTVAVVLWMWELMSRNNAHRVQLLISWALWLLLLLSVGLLTWLHAVMDQHLDLVSQIVLDRDRFRVLHSWYLIISTIQWAASISLLSMTLLNWQSKDLASIKNQ